MRSLLRKMGNSCGVIIPKPLLMQIGASVGDDLDMRLDKTGIVLSLTKQHPRAGWAEAAQKVAKAGADALVWTEFGNADDEKLRW